MRSYLDFEKPVAELDSKVDELRALAATGSDIGEEVSRIEDKAAQALADLYNNLSPWQKTLVARHPQRPHFNDFIKGLITEFTPLAGDRKFGEDEAIVGGFGRFHGDLIVLKNPMTTQPVTLTMSVPQGKLSPTRLATRPEAQYRATLPSAPPMAIHRYAIIVCSCLIFSGTTKRRPVMQESSALKQSGGFPVMGWQTPLPASFYPS